MAVLIEVRTASGNTRRCDATCHAARGTRCGCVCGGRLHGKAHAAAALFDDPARLDELRRTITLGDGEQVQLRFGA